MCSSHLTTSSRVEGGWGGMASPLGIKMVKTIPLMKWPTPPSHPMLFDQLMLKYCHYLIFNILHFICARHVPLIHSILAAKILWTRGSCTYVTSVMVSDSSAACDFSNMANNKRQGQLDLRSELDLDLSLKLWGYLITANKPNLQYNQTNNSEV